MVPSVAARSLPIRVITWITWRWSLTSRRCQWEFFIGRSIGQVGGHMATNQYLLIPFLVG